MAGSAIVYGFVSIVFSSGPFVPKSATDVIESVEQPAAYAWSSEAVRLFPVGGEIIQQDSLRGTIIDTDKNKFQVQEVGVLPYAAYFMSDGEMTVKLPQASISGEEPTYRLVTNVCEGAESIPATTVRMPTKEMLLNASPEMLSEHGTVLGDQAWVITFTVTPEILQQVLMTDFFLAATKNQPESAWVMSKEEQKAIDAGEFITEDASVWINRKGDRLIRQIDLKVKLDSGVRYRVLSQFVPDEHDDPLGDLDLGDGGCELLPGS